MFHLNKSDPVVSIIIPVYNVQDYLSECLDSILNQTYKNIEIVAVDDGSQDKSPEILRSYREEYANLRVVIEEKNQGQAVARNIGMENSMGKYILFVDSDDYIHPQTVEELVHTIETFQVDFVRFNARSFSDKGESIQQKEYNFNLFLKEKKVYAKKEFKNVYLSFSPSPVLYLFKRDLVEKQTIRFMEHIIHEDELFSSEIFLYADSCVYLNRSFYNRRYRQGSTMTKKSEEQLKYSFDSYVKIINYYNDLLLKKSFNKEEQFFLKYRINSLFVPLKAAQIEPSYKHEILEDMSQNKIYYTELYKNYTRLLKVLAIIKKKVG